MSGHSKWSTIKHKKETTDHKRGQIFTKLVRAITVAARDNGPDIDSNFKLRLAVEKARQVNMPKVNIDRAIEKGTGAGSLGFMEAVYEGFGPGNIAVIVAVLTDNKNRAVSELKKIFEKNRGSLGQPGSVSFLFAKKGRLVVEKKAAADEQMLKLIDLGVDDVVETETGIVVITPANRLDEVKSKVEAEGLLVKEAQLVYLAKNSLELDQATRAKAENFLESLTDLDDVQEVYTNL
ncbi:MAG: transcriptional regulator [Candidatus Beckwithbacteria bacterium GW2011_GWA2_43_10]|uniref:Probable transcriptional regulatory protein UV54_C0044G0019 n=1 Tax=Candidatus Beckwithbacteria bacterium GW2011_GWA2_43_10 TaxID=1618369 RepID=A0A0G1C092_9BACT|nr:MAG: transcriptional regulator [Candidatus Beckwithbacteria bacterium GW2011_GWA2_43_10]